MATTMNPGAWRTEHEAAKQRRRREQAGQPGGASATGAPIENRPLNSPRDYARAQGQAQDHSRAGVAGQQQRDRNNMQELNTRSGGGGNDTSQTHGTKDVTGEGKGQAGGGASKSKNDEIKTSSDLLKKYRTLQAMDEAGFMAGTKEAQKVAAASLATLAFSLMLASITGAGLVISLMALLYLNIRWLRPKEGSVLFAPLTFFQQMKVGGLDIAFFILTILFAFLLFVTVIAVRCLTVYLPSTAAAMFLGNLPQCLQ